jgi:hypothetical protein
MSITVGEEIQGGIPKVSITLEKRRIQILREI